MSRRHLLIVAAVTLVAALLYGALSYWISATYFH